MPSFVAIAAMDPQGVIGKEGKLPWHYPEDLKHFDRLTKDQVIIMGYITFLSLPSRILNSRRCFVFTKNHSISESNVTSIKSLKELYDTRPALVNFGEHLLCSSALLDRSKPSRFGATSATLLEPKICCPNSPDLTAHRIYREPPGLVNLEGHPSGPSSNDHSSSIWMQYRSPHDPSNLDHSEALQNSQNLTVRGIRTYSGGLSKTHFVIGGSAIFNLFFAEDLIDEAWITHIHKCYTGDAYFPIHFLTGWCKREFHQEKDFSIIYYKKEKRNGN